MAWQESLWLYLLFLKSYIKVYLEGLIKKILGTKENCQIVNSALSVTYSRNEKVEKVFVPYRRTNIVKHQGHTASLFKGGQKIRDITQSPGVPYLVTAKDLGGDEIHIFHDDEIYKFSADVIPNF